jgi:RND superfamily putative drug exporter
MQTTPSAPRPGALVRWTIFSIRHKWQVLAVWLVGLIVLGFAASEFKGDYSTAFDIPGAESQTAIDLLGERFPAASGDSATLVFQAPAGITDPAVRQQIEAVLAEAAKLPEVVSVDSPYDTQSSISADGTLAYATVQYDKAANDVDKDNAKQLIDLVERSGGDGLTVEVGGSVASVAEVGDLGSAELIGIGVAIVIMLLMFGSVLATGLPIVTALIGVVLGTLVAMLFANVFTLSDSITSAFISMMGLGVGIDYALFIVNRYRDGLLHGQSVEDAAASAINTSGRAVMFAGTTVAIAMLGLIVIQIPFVTGLGIAGAGVVLSSVLIAVTLMPAILGVVGKRVLRYRIPGLGNPAEGETGFWYRWVRFIQRFPGTITIVLIIAIGALAVPYTDIQLGLADAGNGPETLHTRRAYDLLAEGFGPGFNGPLLLVVENDNGLDQDQLASIQSAVQGTSGVVAVTPPTLNQNGDTAILQVIPATSPQDEKTADLVKDLRSNVLPAAVASTGTNTFVAGNTAANIDVSDKISNRMPLFFVIVIGLSLILLAVVFRSIVVPLKAGLMNLLSIGGAYGLLVIVFQWGWGKGLIGVSKDGPVESYLPMILFGIAFGLSMDYEVFLVSRIHEEYTHGRDPKSAIYHGVGTTGKVVAAAGAIMVSVFFGFVLPDERSIKEIGFGLGTAILIDAFLVRLILVPAVMTLLGKRAWYMPAWLDRVLPRISVEGESDRSEATAQAVPGGARGGHR